MWEHENRHGYLRGSLGEHEHPRRRSATWFWSRRCFEHPSSADE